MLTDACQIFANASAVIPSCALKKVIVLLRRVRSVPAGASSTSWLGVVELLLNHFLGPHSTNCQHKENV